LVVVGVGGILAGLHLTRAHFQMTAATGDTYARFIAELSTDDNRVQLVPQYSPLSFEWRDRLSDLLRFDGARKVTLAECLHLMLLFGPEDRVRFEDDRNDCRLVDIVTDSRLGDQILLRRCLTKTNYGVNFVAPDGSRAGEAHRDQCLATLGILGVPLSQTIIIDGEHWSLSDVLWDSTKTFHLKNSELAWTLISYTIYMPEATHWQNAFGETCSFDDLVSEILSRPYERESCGGGHRLSALTMFLLAVRSGRLTSSANIQEQTEQHLRAAFIAVSESQSANGEINSNWFKRILQSSSPSLNVPLNVSSLSITAHLAEWLALLPEDIRESERVLKLSSQWLGRQTAGASAEQANAELCSFTHAVLAADRARETDQSAGTR